MMFACLFTFSISISIRRETREIIKVVAISTTNTPLPHSSRHLADSEVHTASYVSTNGDLESATMSSMQSVVHALGPMLHNLLQGEEHIRKPYDNPHL